jgi:hypothetical protein
MTIMQLGGLINRAVLRKNDRGGNSMNLFIEVLVKSEFNERKPERVEKNKNFNDPGYVLYQSLEYDNKYLSNDDMGFWKNQLNMVIR